MPRGLAPSASRRASSVVAASQSSGEIVAGADRHDAERGAATGRHEAVHGLVDTAVAAGDDNPRRTVAYRFSDLLLEVTDGGALVYDDVDAGFLEQFQDARHAAFGAAAAGNGIQEQGRGSSRHRVTVVQGTRCYNAPVATGKGHP